MQRLPTLRWFIPFVGVLVAIASLAPAVSSRTAAQGSRNLTVLVGAGQDTLQVTSFFPMTVRIRQGDSITWQANAQELHTAAFVKGVTQWGPGAGGFGVGVPGETAPEFAAPIPGFPPEAAQLNPQIAYPTRAPDAPIETYSGPGKFLNSGILTRPPAAAGVPLNSTFSVSFDTPGTYMYICLIHSDRMFGWVDVAPADATDVDQQADVDARASSEIGALMGLAQQAQAEGNATARSEPGPNGTSIWYARAGNQEFETGDPRAQVLDFLPKDVTIRAGDTVVWGTNYFHTVTFVPIPPSPDLVTQIPQPNGPPLLPIAIEAGPPQKPSATYDPTKLFTSGTIGPFTPPGDSWALTFDQPGTYSYVCLYHEALGMKGTVTVLPR